MDADQIVLQVTDPVSGGTPKSVGVIIKQFDDNGNITVEGQTLAINYADMPANEQAAYDTLVSYYTSQ